MGASNRHGGMKLSRRIKTMFMKQKGKREVFRHYFGVKKAEIVEGALPATGTATPATEPAKA
jgi:hypothetical protein